MVEDAAAVDHYLHLPTTIFIDGLNVPAVNTAIQQMQQNDIEAGVLLHRDIVEALNAFKKKMNVITAAGGLVHTPNKKILLIHRRGKWDLPKGKLDEGEDIETCAIREVKEETGLKRVAIETPMLPSYHSYIEDQQLILKETHWYLMKAEEQPLQPQTNEDIEQCEWVSITDVPEYLANTYALVHDVVNEGLQKMKK